MKHMIVLFTRKDALEGQRLSDFIDGTAEKDAQVHELVGLIDKMVQGNGGTHFSDAVYEDTEEKLKRQAEQLRKIYADQLEKEIKLVEKQWAHKTQQEIER
ncbi:GTPase IMAP family member 7-like, partial [Pteropus medius]|uniref:GTPase IMAP family member 7-like n=1 Tax=Pteropus vampyrus TaxID=132908 RepID=UPI00196A94DD